MTSKRETKLFKIVNSCFPLTPAYGQKKYIKNIKKILRIISQKVFYALI